jgi:hypothetical protein
MATDVGDSDTVGAANTVNGAVFEAVIGVGVAPAVTPVSVIVTCSVQVDVGNVAGP